MDFSLLQLITSFLLSITLGFAFGVLYEPVRIFHLWGYNKNIHYFVSDIFIMVFFGIITYFYCLTTLEGKVRMFVIWGEIIGFFLYFRLIAPISGKIFGLIIKITQKVLSKLLKNCRSLMYNIGYRFSCLFSFLINVCKKAGNRVNNKVKRYEKVRNKGNSTGNPGRSKNKKEKNK